MGKGKLKKALGSSKGKKALAIAGGVAGAIGLGVGAKKLLSKVRGGAGAGGKRRKKSVTWLSKEILRVKLQRKLNREKLKGY